MKVVAISQPAACASSPKLIRGRGLPARKLSKPSRALLGAEIKEGAIMLTDMSVRQIAAVLGVSPGYINAALTASPLHREAVRRGLRPLVDPHAKASPEKRLAKIIGEIGADAVLSLLASEEKTAA
jgi:hypothetical protein